MALFFTLFLGLLLKLPCASGNWSDGRPYRHFCYTDIIPLFKIEGLASGKFPYLGVRNEYPVGTGLTMGVTGLAVGTDSDFFLVNVAVLALAGFATAALLFRMVGPRTVLFALAPTLLLYAFLNWDLLPVALTAAGTYAFLKRRDGAAGVLVGLGAVAKIYPAFALLPFFAQRRSEGRTREGARMVGIAAGTWVALNLPFALASFRNWSYFFRFNARRGVEWATLWFGACHRFGGGLGCRHISVLNAVSLALFVVGLWVNWRLKVSSSPDFARWTFVLPLLVILLLTTKVYSPQYSLWLLPWFALVRVDLWTFLAFEAADVAVFVTEFSWLGRFTGFGGLPVGAVEIAALARAIALVAVLAAYLRDGRPATEEPAASGAPGERLPALPG